MAQIPWEGFILAILPFVGKFLLGIPWVSNKLIPFILLAFNFAMKYWLVLGWPTTTQTAQIQHGAVFALSWGQLWVFVWACIDGVFAHNFYEGRRAKATLNGTTSWWEQGKNNWWR